MSEPLSRAPKAQTFVYVGDVERILELFECVENFLPHNLEQPDLDVISRLAFRAARTRASVEGTKLPLRPDAEDRHPKSGCDA
jgi:hypothetical protein